MGKRWTNDEIQFLKDNPNMAIKEISEKLKRTKKSIESQRFVYNITNKNISWTKEEDNLVKKHYPQTGVKELSAKLNRSIAAINNRAKTLQVKYIGQHQYIFSKDELQHMYIKQKLSTYQIADKIQNKYNISCSAGTVARYLKKFKITIRPNGESQRKGTLAKDKYKKCSTCLEYKLTDEFRPSLCHKDKLHSICRKCTSIYHRTKRAKKCGFHLTNKQASKIYDGTFYCSICNKQEVGRDISLDHNKITGVIRGLLCNKCNTGIGLLNSDKGTQLLEKAIEYIKNPPGLPI